MKRNTTDPTVATKKSKKDAQVVFRHPLRIPSLSVAQVKTEEDFEAAVAQTVADPDAVVCFFLYATWSTPCKSILTQYEALLKKLSDIPAPTSIEVSKEPGEAIASVEPIECTESIKPTTPIESIEPTKEPIKEPTKEPIIKPITITFYKIDKDAAPKSCTNGKVPIFFVYRNGSKLADVATQGKGLEKFLAKMKPAVLESV
ncbi:hypothetical protein HDU81_008478 [Chytriomyces hyalinus]|nr:hypothetical protein HDU81_008478 [Chytriomyces hyalinus]